MTAPSQGLLGSLFPDFSSQTYDHVTVSVPQKGCVLSTLAHFKHQGFKHVPSTGFQVFKIIVEINGLN